jgi:sugar lactone lactonase YvrE
MTEKSRKIAFSRSRTALVLGAVAATVVAVAACGDETTAEGAKPTIDLVANDPLVESPFDATPSPDGKDVYFIAMSRVPNESGNGTMLEAGIFTVSATGGAVKKLHSGAPLVAPFGITISNDGQTLFLADTAAATSEERADGRIYTMGVGGGAPAALAGTDGYAPAGVEVQGDFLYFTGKKDGQAGLFKTGLAGGAVTPVAVGPAFVDPGGVALSKTGEAYVVDTGSGTHEAALASVVKVFPDGRTEILAQELAVGHPAGIAISNNERTVYVSGLDPTLRTDVVFTIDTASRTTAKFSDVIAEHTASAGLHRARNANVFAWADSHANATGSVYVLRGL